MREQLAGVSLPNDAIGWTREVTGTIVVEPNGAIVASQSRFRVNLQTLASDQSRRDNFLRSNTLESSRYPYAEFVPTLATGLAVLPQSGEVTFKPTGDLTIRNVTKQVAWDVTGQVQGNQATLQAKTNFTFAHFNLTQPRVPVVLSIEDNIRLEMDLQLRPGGDVQLCSEHSIARS